jgi:hypothetical protein
MRDAKVSAIETRIGVGAKISELLYRADSSAALNNTKPAEADMRAHRIANPTGAMLGALARAEEQRTTEPEILALQVTVDVRLRHPDSNSLTFERTLLDAYTIFLDQLNPWNGPGMTPRMVERFDAFLRPLPLEAEPASGMKAVFGSSAGEAYVEMFLNPLTGAATTPGDRSLRLNLVLGKGACAVNGLCDVRTLLAANGRHIFGRYIHLASGEKYAGIGDLNARVKRELGRMLQRAAAAHQSPG